MGSRCGVMMFIILPFGNLFADLIIFRVRMREVFDDFDYLLRRTYGKWQGSD
jgi:hypothetical protein